MLTAFIRAFRTPDLRKKLLFTVFIIAVFRLGQQLPTPGVSQSAVQRCLSKEVQRCDQAIPEALRFSFAWIQVRRPS